MKCVNVVFDSLLLNVSSDLICVSGVGCFGNQCVMFYVQVSFVIMLVKIDVIRVYGFGCDYVIVMGMVSLVSVFVMFVIVIVLNLRLCISSENCSVVRLDRNMLFVSVMVGQSIVGE